MLSFAAFRMYEGVPLRYFGYQPNYHHQLRPIFLVNEDLQHQHQQQQQIVDIRRMSKIEDLMPHSPNSVQSDSENSVSSLEGSHTWPVQIKSPKPLLNKVQCCWKMCGLYFDSLDLLAMHVSKAHSASGTGGLFYCGWEGCTRNNKGFNARYKMLVHVRTHTNEKPHQCSQCEKSFSRAENLKIHSRSHSGEKPYVCTVPGCNKAYSNSSDRFKHTRTHQVDKPYHCKVPGCTKRYTDPSSLRKHVKTFKHFDTTDSNANSKKLHQQENEGLSSPTRKSPELSLKNYHHQYIVNSPLINPLPNSPKHCNCPYACCVTNTEATELIKIRELINLQSAGLKSLQIHNWNRISSNEKLTTKYDTKSCMDDVDMDELNLVEPLDLSVSQKHKQKSL